MSVNSGFNDDPTRSTSFSISVDEPAENINGIKTPEDVEGGCGNSSSIASAPEDIPAPYAGMPKDVLLHYSRQKRFVWARNILTGAVILTILTLLSMVIALIAVSPSCQQFWQTSPIYQIYPKSFMDSTNDGIGDLNGIKQKLSYLSDDLGVTTLWLNPVYKSPQRDNGYDIEDYRAIDALFGDLGNMEDLITEMHNQGMKVIMDFVPNHSSDQHEWFLASSNISHPNYDKYKDYYVWANSTNGTSSGIPNNWQSVFDTVETSSWEWNDMREQFYYHAFYKEQPDLNLRNPAVQQELKDILSYWMEKGVDGFRCDAVAYMLEATHLRSNPLKNASAGPSYSNCYPDYTENQLGIHDIIADWRTVLNKYSTEPGVYRFMETEVYDDVETVVRYYGTDLVKEADFPMNFRLIDLGKGDQWTGTKVESTILEWMRKMPSGKWPNWVIGNHDNSRTVTRLGAEKAKIAAVLILTLSGTPGIYYGEELGMEDNPNVPNNDIRNPERTPMQWDNSSNAGFCSNCTPWLNVGDSYTTNNINVAEEKEDPNSMLTMYKTLIQLRSDLTFLRGSICMIQADEQTLVFIREMPGATSKLVAINFDVKTSAEINIGKTYQNLPTTGTTIFTSKPGSGGQGVGTEVNFDSMELQPGEAVIVEYKPGGGKNMFTSSAQMADRCFTSKRVCINVMGLLEVC